MVATGAKGERWIIPAAKFPKLYTEAVGTPGFFDPKGKVKGVVWTGESTTFVAPWGEEMIIEEGDMLVTSEADDFDPTKLYRIEKSAFEATYRPVPEVDIEILKTKSPEELEALGMQKSDKNLYLFPFTWYNHIPESAELTNISFRNIIFQRGKTSDDYRGGMLGYGILLNN
jgi:hypothetical protein